MNKKKDNNPNHDEKKYRHILSLSGGKDSTALALYMRDRIPNMEYVFCDTGEELPETKDYLLKIEAQLNVKIIRLNPDRPFDHYLKLYNGVLPDPRTRWCTRMLKLRPFEKYIGDDPVCLYVGIRADEPKRTGYVSSKPNIIARFPFVQDGLRYGDIMRLLNDSGLGLPEYYKWRSRSGCYFCFFQQRREWVGLLENHPTLYKKAAAFEKHDTETGRHFTWVENESLIDLERPARMQQIKDEYKARLGRSPQFKGAAGLMDLFSEDSEPREGCSICHL